MVKKEPAIPNIVSLLSRINMIVKDTLVDHYESIEIKEFSDRDGQRVEIGIVIYERRGG